MNKSLAQSRQAKGTASRKLPSDRNAERSDIEALDYLDRPRAPKPARFQPWQRVWQCNDIRVTETVNQPGIVSYDLGGTIWGGSRFNVVRGSCFSTPAPARRSSGELQ